MTTTLPSNTTYNGETVKVGDIVYQITDNPDFTVRLLTLTILSINNNILNVGELLDDKVTNIRNVTINNVHTNPLELLQTTLTKNIEFRDIHLPRRLDQMEKLIMTLSRNQIIEGNEVI